jgi:hypothetical protein
MRPVVFGEALPAGTRLTLLSADKPDRFFTVIKFWMDATSGVALELKTGVPSYQVEDEEGRIHLLIHLAIDHTRRVPTHRHSATTKQPTHRAGITPVRVSKLATIGFYGNERAIKQAIGR